MSPYAFYQFWLNQGDAEVGGLLRVFTFLSRAEIEVLEAEHADKPFLRAAQRRLAAEVTTLVHGADATHRIEEASAALFSGEPLGHVDADVLVEALGTARPLVAHSSGQSLTDLFVESGLVQSRSEARRAFAEGGAYVNNERAEDPDYVPTGADFVGGRVLVLRRGKKNFAGVSAP
jgi:tyrosyl-tRNA synthetase